MAVVAMQKVAILAEKSLKEELLEALHREGVLQVTETKDAVHVDHTEVQFKEAELQFAIDTLREVATKDTIAATQKHVDEATILQASRHTDVRGIVDTLHTLEEDDATIERSAQELLSQLAILQPWMGLPYTLDAAMQSNTTIRMLGTLPTAKVSELEHALQASLPRTSLLPCGESETTTSFVAHVWKQDIHMFEELATAAGWTTTTLPSLASTAGAACQDMAVQLRELEIRKKKNADARQRLSAELPHLLHVATFLRWLNEKQSVREAIAETQATITILGWMPRNRVAIVETHLQKLSPAVVILKVKHDEGEEAPVLLRNSTLVTPFESVTGLYGLPLYNELDPTKSLSPFFIVFFSLCLTDAGYGAVLALIFGIILWKKKPTVGEAPLFWLLFMCGVMTFFVSIPFGGWFGLQPDRMPAMLTKTTADGTVLFKGQIWNLGAQEGISFLQNLAMVLGLTHLFFGMWLAGMHKWLHGEKAAAFWQSFTSHILLAASILYYALPSTYTKYALILAIVAFIWGKGHGSPWYTRPIFGLLGMANFAIGLLSNSLSYLRILALGLVTGALALAVDQVAIEMSKLFPLWLAIPVMLIIFIIGHIVSIALNTLGSFIHSGRLQFIEFFSQFFEGGGQPFSPFKRST